jgi:hypothetical protein
VRGSRRVRPGFRLQRWQLVASGLVFLACLLGAAWLGGYGSDSFGWVLGRDALQAVSAAALAFGGVGGLLDWRARRRWESAIQVIAVDLLNATRQALDEAVETFTKKRCGGRKARGRRSAR